MAQNAIGASPGIFLTGAQQYQQANRNIFDAINAAADMYDKWQMQREANLNSIRSKQAEIMSDPEKASQAILTKAYQYGPDSLTPQERAIFEASQKVLSTKVALNPLTQQAYSPYQAIDINSINNNPASAITPFGNKPVPSPAAAAFLPDVKEEMLPPRVDKKTGTIEQFNTDMGAPTPIGQTPIKAPKVSVDGDTTGMADTPAGKMETFKANLDAQKTAATESVKAQMEQKKSDFYKPKLQVVLDKIANINEQLNQLNALKSGDNSGAGNAKAMAAGAKILGVPLGRASEEVFNKKVASLRDQYDGLRSNALALYKNAANIAAGSLNSDQEQKLALDSFGDANGNYEANKAALESTMESFGTKKAKPGVDGVKGVDGVDSKDPRVKKALDAGYSLDEIKAYLNGRK